MKALTGVLFVVQELMPSQLFLTDFSASLGGMVITLWVQVLADLTGKFYALAAVWGRRTKAFSFVMKAPRVVQKDSL